MFAVTTYEEIEQKEKLLNEKHIIILLLVRPSLSGADNIIADFNYLHHNSEKYCSIYAVGYSEKKDEQSYQDYKAVTGPDGATWYYSDHAFVHFKDKLQTRLKWRYCGNIELLILQSNPEGRNVLNFGNYLSIDMNYGIAKKYIPAFPNFMEALIHASKAEVEVRKAAAQMQNNNYKLRDIVAQAIDEFKPLPTSVKTIVKDRLFYRTSKSYSS